MEKIHQEELAGGNLTEEFNGGDSTGGNSPDTSRFLPIMINFAAASRFFTL